MKWLLRHPRTLALAGRVLGAYLRFTLRTTRWTLHEGEAAPYVHAPKPAIFAFWHERLLMMSALWTLSGERRPPGERGRMHVLISRHQDGRLIADILRGFGVGVVHGSSGRKGTFKDKQRGGATGLRALVAVLDAGDQVVITPDGPRGPRRTLAPGVAQLAALAGVPVVPCAAQSRRRRILPSWDRMVLPLPFSRGVLVCGTPIVVPRHAWAGALPCVEAALTAAADQADALCAG